MKRSKFSLSNYKLLTCDMGQLVPIGLTEVLPGDSIQQSTTALVRASPLLAPVMHPVDVRIHHWFVPHRLVWDDFEDFITGGPDGNNASDFPTITVNPTDGTLADYLGVPTGTSMAVSALPFRGYAHIWNEWYRDQDLETALVIDTTDGADSTTNTTLQHCAWEKDYLTAARPWEQKGPAITLPIGDSAPIATDATLSEDLSIYFTEESGQREMNTSAGGNRLTGDSDVGATDRSMYADLSSVSGASVNLLREAFALQRFEEARARYGSRYTEYLRYLGVRSSDARLQRPEYLAGGRNKIQFSEVLSTNGATGGGLADLGGHGIAATRSNKYRRYIEEHGYVHSFVSIRPKTMYIDGLPRHFNRRVKEDFWQKELEHIGQQEVLNKEVYTAHATPEGVFGYSDRYAEYRSNPSWVSGDFRSTLDHWHFARAFGSDPALNAAFVKCVPPETAFAASSDNTMWLEVKHSIQARRLVSANTGSKIF